jgi:hypothetical protein
MTLRTYSQENEDVIGVNFEGFSDIGEESESRTGGFSRGVVETVKFMFEDMQRQNSDVSLWKKRRACACQCHTLIQDEKFDHLETCLEVCPQTEEMQQQKSQELLEVLMEHGVHYIEKPQEKKKTRFRNIKNWFKRVSWEKPHSSVNLSVNTPTSASQKRLSLIEGDIEILVESHGYVPLPPENTQRSINADNELLNIHPPNSIPLYLQDTDKHSSYSRKHLKPTSSMVSLVRTHTTDGDCKCVICEKKALRGREPWKVVMNDISLYAALLSTGQKPLRVSKSSLNLVLDFTQSKHQYNKRISSNESELISMRGSLLNDENLIIDTDLLDLREAEVPTRSKSMNGTAKSTTLKIQTLLRTQTHRPISKTSSLSESLKDKYSEKSPQYNDVLLNYNYSDDSLELSHRTSVEVLPLKIPKNATRIF